MPNRYERLGRAYVLMMAGIVVIALVLWLFGWSPR